MSGISTAPPQDVQYKDLTPADVAYIQQTVPIDARMNGFVATITTDAQANGLTSVTIRYSAAAPVPPAQIAPAAAALPTAPAASTSINFTVGGRPLQQADFDRARNALGGIEANLLWALLRQEGGTPPVGFLSDRRPGILYERHIFAAQSDNRFTATYPDISGPRYTVYGTLAQQYDRLNAAMVLDRNAALQACSWGIAQVLGTNASVGGFASVVTMVQAMISSEAAQLDACVKYLLSTGSRDSLANKDWQDFARTYNGPGNVAQYASSVEANYTACSRGPMPDLRVRAAQLMLTYIHHPVAVDGVTGPATAGAIAAFQKLAGITPADGTLTDATFDAITRGAFP